MKNALILVAGLFLLTSACQHKIQPDLSNKVTPGATIEAVDLRGNRMPSETIRRGLHSRAGDRVSLQVIKSDIEFLYALGFEEVRVDEFPGVRVGKVVVFSVKEKALPPQKATP